MAVVIGDAMQVQVMQIRLDTATEARLAQAATRLGEAPDDLAVRAVGTYLEDLEDYSRAVEAWNEHAAEGTKSLTEMKQELGLAS